MFAFDEEKKEDLGTWFSFQESHLDIKAAKYIFDDPTPDAPKFRFRSPIPFYQERRRNRKKGHMAALNPRTLAMERISYSEDLTPAEEKKELDDLRDYVLTGIDGAKWASGKDIQCDRESKLKLYLNENFERFAGHCIAMLAGLETEAAEQAEKN